MEFEELLKLMVQKGGSDLFITAGVPPSMKVHGKILPVTKNALTPDMTRDIVFGVMTENNARISLNTTSVTSPSPPAALAVSGSRPFTSATWSAWCCGVLKPRSPMWMTCAYRR